MQCHSGQVLRCVLRQKTRPNPLATSDYYSTILKALNASIVRALRNFKSEFLFISI